MGTRKSVTVKENMTPKAMLMDIWLRKFSLRVPWKMMGTRPAKVVRFVRKMARKREVPAARAASGTDMPSSRHLLT